MINLPIRKGWPKLLCFAVLAARDHNLPSHPGWSGRRVVRPQNAQDPRHRPVGPESPPVCSDRKATGPSAMLHR